MHSKLLYQFCCWNDGAEACRILEDFDDIDILYKEGAIIRVMIANNQIIFLKAALDYFENQQFKTKDDQYKEASGKLIEILEEATDGIDSSSEIHAIISTYIGNDIACLSDVYAPDELESLGYPHIAKYGVTVSSAIFKVGGSIEDCLAAAKLGDAEVIKQNLDITNRIHKLMVISVAIQNEQEGILQTIVEMAHNNKQKATILRTAADTYVKNRLFEKAEEYYHKSFKMHPNYYITYSKIGALYQIWSGEDFSAIDHEALKEKAIQNYVMALKNKPERIKYINVKERFKILHEQLELLRSHHSDSKDAVSKSFEATDELLSYISADEVDILGDSDL